MYANTERILTQLILLVSLTNLPKHRKQGKNNGMCKLLIYKFRIYT